ncbi:MAG: flagellar biosynthesis protein FlhB [Pseudomonadota bacterium]
MAEAENGQEKTEEPTPRKLEKAREEGQTARSRELVTCLLVMTGAILLLFWVPLVMDGFIGATRNQFAAAGELVWHHGDGAAEATLRVGLAALAIVSVPLLGSFAIGILGNIAVGGVLFSAKAMAPKLSRLNPLKGLKRMFSSRSLIELLKSIGKILLIAGMAIAFLLGAMNRFLSLSTFAPIVGYQSGLVLVLTALLLFGAVLVLIAAIDIPHQIHEQTKQLKMTLQEVKDEMKDTEGRPEVKQRIRRAQQALASNRMMAEVPTADVIITNPEHFAVALRYEAGSSAPTVVAAGVDMLALKLREIASEHAVPQLRVPPLARALYFSTAVGEMIPADLYAAVAQVLAYLQNLDSYRRHRSGPVPKLGRVAIPLNRRRSADGRPEIDDA